MNHVTIYPKQYVWALADGTIVADQLAAFPIDMHIPGATMHVLDLQPGPIDHVRHRFADGQIVERPLVDVARLKQPSLLEVGQMIALELNYTDRFTLQDFPAPQETKDEFLVYRQALRDLSKNYATAAEYIANWPARPDGSDAIEHLRSKL